MNLGRFLAIARCPAREQPTDSPCSGALVEQGDALICQQCGASYTLSDPHRIPVFAPRSMDDLRSDKYEDPAQRLAEGYVAQWAYGYLFLQRGESEGFYRTISELGFSAPLPQGDVRHVLEIGCGVGRTTCDYARHYAQALVVGLDYSPNLLSYAYQMVIGDTPQAQVVIDLEPEGYGKVTAPTFGVSNAYFVQANALALPFAADQFDLVVSPNLIDRLLDPAQMIREAARVLRPGGSLIVADPFNWTAKPEWWERVRSVDDLAALIRQSDLAIDLAFDGLIYRERLDRRRASTEWQVAVVRATKR